MDPNQSIEKLVDYHVADDGSEYYLVKWKQTWEKADSLRPFNLFITQFWEYIDEKHKSNVSHNTAALPKPPPVLPPTPAHTPQPIINHPNMNTNNVRSSPAAGKKRANSTSAKTPTTPKSSKQHNNTPNSNSFQTQQRPMNMNSPVGQFSNIATSPFPHNLPQQPQQQQHHLQSMPPNQNNPGRSTVVIDSDDDDSPVITEDIKPNITAINNSIQAMNTQMSTANTPMKTEPMDHPMFSPNMHVGNPFSFPPVGFPPMGNNNMPPATSPSERGRGQGPGQLVKRKIDMPGSISPGHNFKMEQPNNIKQELPPGGGMPLNNFPMNQQPPQQQQSSSPSLNWQDYMETLESYVNGQRAAVTYKCRLCGAAIAQRGNFPRHFKMHQKNS